MAQINGRLALDEGWTLVAEGKADEALAKAGASGADPLAAGMLRGLAHYATGNDAEAVAAWRGVLAADPQNPVAALYLPLALFRSGDRKGAGEALGDPALIILPHRGWLTDFVELFWPLRAEIHRGNPVPDAPPGDRLGCDYNRWKSALGEEASAAVEKPALRLAGRYQEVGLGVYEKGDLYAAAHHFSRACELSPRDEEFAVHYAFVLLLLGRTEEASHLIEPRIEAVGETDHPPHPDLLAVYAWTLHERGEYRQALQVIGCVVPEGPDDWGCHFLAAVNWLMLGERGRYQAALNRALEGYFIDTWEQLLRPFVRRTRRWIGADSLSQDR